MKEYKRLKKVETEQYEVDYIDYRNGVITEGVEKFSSLQLQKMNIYLVYQKTGRNEQGKKIYSYKGRIKTMTKRDALDICYIKYGKGVQLRYL